MNVTLCYETGYDVALLGVGLSYGLTSNMSYRAFRSTEGASLRAQLHNIAIKLSKQDGGEDKFLRQMVVCLDITAPRFWWIEMDTYKVGTTAQSESTMHTIMKREIERSDFEIPLADGSLDYVIKDLNACRETRDFRKVVQCLPQSYRQRRIWTGNYAVLKNIFNQRANHKLREWHTFINTVHSLIMYPEFLPCKTR